MLLDLPTFFLRLVLPDLQSWAFFEARQRVSRGIRGQWTHISTGKVLINIPALDRR